MSLRAWRAWLAAIVWLRTCEPTAWAPEHFNGGFFQPLDLDELLDAEEADV